jgi:diguanylate cyclase (GGDEF)-like protein
MASRGPRSRRFSFALSGLVLAAGAPCGLLAVRVAAGRASLDSLGDEWRRERLTYTYVTLSTAFVFACFGAALGRAADRQSRLATSDGLTSLLNRRGMQARIAAEIRRQRRYPAPLSLLLLDVDRMKDINDRFGHAAGDAALRRVARAIRGQSRQTDAASRWGGDEFLVLAPDTTRDDAAILASRIQEALAAPGSHPAVSVSIGVATVPASAAGPSPEELLQAADDALYQAKHAGRDRSAARTWR